MLPADCFVNSYAIDTPYAWPMAMTNNEDARRYTTTGFLEFGTAFMQEFVRGTARPTQGVVNGMQMDPAVHKDPSVSATLVHQSVAMGGVAYQYMLANTTTGLWTDGEGSVRFNMTELASVHGKIRDIRPFIDNASTLYHAAILYSESSRYRYDNYDRWSPMALLKELYDTYIVQSLPLAVMTNLDLNDPILPPEVLLDAYRLIVVPDASGFTPQQLRALRQYVDAGGSVLVTGDSLRFDSNGHQVATAVAAAAAANNTSGSMLLEYRPEGIRYLYVCLTKAYPESRPRYTCESLIHTP